MNTPRLVIIADDLTGAADSAARAVQAGLDAAIFPASSVVPVDDPVLAQVVAISTDSRGLSADAAAERMTRVMNQLRVWRDVVWYKKIDSTLRGNLGAELAAMLAALGPETQVAICPAFPAQGRGLEEGYLVLGDDHLHRVYLPDRLAEETYLPVAAIDLAVVRRGLAALADAMTATGDVRLLVIDGKTDDDLAVIVAAASRLGTVLCGSAGMVAPLAARLADGLRRPVPVIQADGPLLAVVGSGSAAAQAQVRAVAESGCMRVREAGPGWRGLDLLGASGHPMGDWLFHLPAPRPETPLEGPAARCEAARLADLVVAAVAAIEPSDLMLVGGDTATYVLRGLGIERLEVIAELMPGIPLTVGVDRGGVQRRVVLKPGSFGDERVLVALWQLLRADRREMA